MIWYLLYPLRGTTQPPRLSANSSIRRAFYRHGKNTAQHWLVAMLVSVAIAAAFSYPTILLAENPTAGFAAYPHHVWTTAKPYEGDPNHADVEMRQVWIHGSYMRALEKDTLKHALDIQQTVVGGEPLASIFPSLREKLRSSTLDWGYHSPLMYWNSSHKMIDRDDDVLRTINDQARSTSSSLNVALRPASVFAGKKFSHQKLIAADALVITLMNKISDGDGDQWKDRMKSLTSDACSDCTLFPRNGHVTRNRIYEFSFKPLSVRENIALTFAYTCMALYVLLSLRRLKAFHSRFGLVVTAITQMTCSILASFTICGILKINLSMIPQNAYPFVVLVVGIENMFRIVNAVVAYPPTMATDLRIANALGDVGPVSIATVVQNLTILSLLSRVVSPGVAAFCAFACIATLFDAFFLLTFFVAVLNVDIRRFELQDALARANQTKQKRRPSPGHHHTWFDALVHGRLPFSTRMAGTAVTTTFILSLNYHFFEHKEKATNIRELLRLIKNGPPMVSEFDSFAPAPINASLTPGQWMRMQDSDTAKEVMRLAKPGADSFIVRVFAPLIIVLSGADRTDMDEEEAWLTAFRSFAIHHFYPVAVAVVFAVTFVAVLMNFLLYSDQEDEPSPELDDLKHEEVLKVQSVALPHKLDIVKMTASQKGHLVSVGLDRTIAITLLDPSQQTQRILSLPTEALAAIRWPIHSITLDDSGEWMACHCADDQILLYCCAKGSFVNSALTYPDDNPPLLFEFSRLPGIEGNQLHFTILTSGGRLATHNADTGDSRTTRLAEIQLLGACVQEFSSQDQADIQSYTWAGDGWVPGISRALQVPTFHGRVTGAVRIEQDSDLGPEVLLVVMSRHVVFLDSQSLALLGRLDAVNGEKSISRIMFGQVKKCPLCGQLAFTCAALVGDASNDGECTVTTLWAKGENDAVICLKDGTGSCNTIDRAQRTKHSLAEPGAWSAITSHAVLGLRKPPAQQPTDMKSSRELTSPRLRHRRHTRTSTPLDDAEDVWEAYKLSLDGEIETKDLLPHDNLDAGQDTALYVSNAGPAVALDSQSVAVAFGNAVKIIKSARRGSMARRPTGRTFDREPTNSKDAPTLRQPQ
ncbi:hypothetical protein LTR37_003810 [Vermiconidia calcicola]|uniref:Uncharacterized protein n=1 Tax=Vermiconidia calcicola TaxID=1690605 RepID=A0ACC3NRP5_9PEZI|nr:hypothetical protein LTR37_003810 [Vermiconidia calcicola]